MKTSKQLMDKSVEVHGLNHPIVRVFFDGACEPKNPGGVATCGWIAYGVDDEVVASESRFVTEGHGATNNVAEYHALGYALRWLLDSRDLLATVEEVRIFGDSQLVCNQVSGTWKCNKSHLRKLRDRCQELLYQLEEHHAVSLRWIPRDENEAADSLSREAYENYTRKTFPVRTR